MTRAALSDERGETLVELMITIMVMAIGMTAVVAALYTTIIGSDAHHSMSAGEVVARDYGEAIKAQAIATSAYIACPSSTDLTPTDFDPAVAGGGWHAQIDAVEYWVPASDPKDQFVTVSPCIPNPANPWAVLYQSCLNALGSGGFKPACDYGAQRVTFHVWNDRTDYGKTEVTARVLTRRNDAGASS